MITNIMQEYKMHNCHVTFRGDYDVDDLIDNHTFEYKGVLFVYPEKVIEYKRKMK